MTATAGTGTEHSSMLLPAAAESDATAVEVTCSGESSPDSEQVLSDDASCSP